MKIIAYLRLPISAAKIWLETRQSDYQRREKWHIFWALLSMRVKEISGSKRAVVSHDIFGFRVHAYDYRNLRFLFQEIFLSRAYFFESDKPNPRVIDCGANIGMAVLFIKHIFPDARITAFEPNPSTFELLKLNVEANGLKDVEVVNKALSNSNEPVCFFVNDDKGTLLASVRRDRGGVKDIRVETELLSDWVDEDTDLVKMDVEGAEWLIVEDLKQHPSRMQRIDQLIVEYHHRIGAEKSRFAAFLSFFEHQGYEYNLKAHYRYRGDFQDVVVHFYR